MLNYLDGVAIGICQGLYHEGLARDHLQSIVNVHVDRYAKTPKYRFAELLVYRCIRAKMVCYQPTALS
jgi:hypothetical protein